MKDEFKKTSDALLETLHKLYLMDLVVIRRRAAKKLIEKNISEYAKKCP